MSFSRSSLWLDCLWSERYITGAWVEKASLLWLWTNHRLSCGVCKEGLVWLDQSQRDGCQSPLPQGQGYVSLFVFMRNSPFISRPTALITQLPMICSHQDSICCQHKVTWQSHCEILQSYSAIFPVRCILKTCFLIKRDINGFTVSRSSLLLLNNRWRRIRFVGLLGTQILYTLLGQIILWNWFSLDKTAPQRWECLLIRGPCCRACCICSPGVYLTTSADWVDRCFIQHTLHCGLCQQQAWRWCYTDT
jgi:hypothetical protein